MPEKAVHMIRAAGGVLWRRQETGVIEVALVHRPRYGDWSLPKGKLRSGEHPLAAACREVLEETGIRPIAGRRLDVGHYGTAHGPKAVEYWAMQGSSDRFAPTQEVDSIAWLPLAEARPRLDHHNDTYALDALEALETRSAGIAAVLLVRNGHAVPVRRWAGRDFDRPLTTRGREQAEALRLALPAFMPSRLLAAPQLRFMATMTPLGEDLQLPVEPEPSVAEEPYALRPRDGLARIQELAGAGPITAVCAPATVIRHLITDLADEGSLALGDVRARKGSAWALFFSAGQLAAADYYPALTSPRYPALADTRADTRG